MEITLNGEPREVAQGTTLASLLAEVGVRPPYAVELNRQVCPKGRHGETPLGEGDVVEIVTIVGGG